MNLPKLNLTKTHWTLAGVLALVMACAGWVVANWRQAAVVGVGATAATASAWTCQSCVPLPGPGTGGAASTGGRASTGGSIATGGHVATGGKLSTGGSSAPSTVVQCPVTPAWPSVLSSTPADMAEKAVHRTFPARRTYTLRAITDYEVSANICSSWNEPNELTDWDQGEEGSCTGNAADQMICTHPFTTALSLCNETTARTIYENGTCVDNGCSIPCTCTSCKSAFCPTTNANDTGSQGSSVFAYLVKMGYVKGDSVVGSTDALALGLSHSSCMIGIDYYNSMMATDATGRLVVTKSSGLAGGHELNVIAWDAVNSRFWVRNSWGKWGMCRTGGDCGYAWISPADLITLNFDANCPVLQ